MWLHSLCLLSGPDGAASCPPPAKPAAMQNAYCAGSFIGQTCTLLSVRSQFPLARLRALHTVDRLLKKIEWHTHCGRKRSHAAPAIFFTDTMLTQWHLSCLVLFGVLFPHVLAQQPGCPSCALIADCTTCVVGGNTSTIRLQLRQKPENIPPMAVAIANSYSIEEIFFPCNKITCYWNRQQNVCADLNISNLPSLKLPQFPAVGNFVTPFFSNVLLVPDLQFDLFNRLEASRYCQDVYGKHL